MTPDHTGPSIFKRAAGLKRLEIDRSLTCQNCSYDLRGLDILGACPECGTSVETTIRAKASPSAVAKIGDQVVMGLRGMALAWSINAVILITCCVAPFGALLFFLAALGRVLATGVLRPYKDFVPEEPPPALWPVGMLASITLVLGGTLALTMLGVNSGPAVEIMLMLCFLAVTVEGFSWMSWMSTQADRLECPIVGPVGRYARWLWVLLVPLAIFIGILSATQGPMLLIILGVATSFFILCALLTALVTAQFADIIPQLELAGVLEDSWATRAHQPAPAPHMGPVVDETPLDVAESTNEEIRTNKSALNPIKPGEPEPEQPIDDEDPDTPMGIY